MGHASSSLVPTFLWSSFFIFIWETLRQSFYLAQVDLKLVILLSPSPQCWDHAWPLPVLWTQRTALFPFTLGSVDISGSLPMLCLPRLCGQMAGAVVRMCGISACFIPLTLLPASPQLPSHPGLASLPPLGLRARGAWAGGRRSWLPTGL